MRRIDALMSVHGGVCPKCRADVTLTEIGGTVEFLDEHYGVVETTVVKEKVEGHSPFYEAALNVLTCDAKTLATHVDIVKTVAMSPGNHKKHTVTKRSKRDEVVWEVPEGVEISEWIARSDPYDVGCLYYVCSNPDCRATYETYALLGGDWDLGGHPEFD